MGGSAPGFVYISVCPWPARSEAARTAEERVEDVPDVKVVHKLGAPRKPTPLHARRAKAVVAVEWRKVVVDGVREIYWKNPWLSY